MLLRGTVKRFIYGGPVPKPEDNSLSARVDRLHYHRDQVMLISADIKTDLDKVGADVAEAMGKLTKPA